MNTSLNDQVIDVLKTIYDPEIPTNIYALGLIYNVQITEDKVAEIRMTLTTPNCPAAEILPAEVQSKVKAIEGINDCKIELVWDPPWSMDKMVDEAIKLDLGLF